MKDFTIVLQFDYKGKVIENPFYELRVSTDTKLSQEELLEWLDWAAERIEEMKTLQRVK